MLRNALITSALILTLALAGCTGKSGTNSPINLPPTLEPAPAPAPVGTADPTTPANPPAPEGKSTVSSTITIPDEPWITAPASVSVLTRQVRIQLSGPVDKASVEALLPPGPVWNGEQEVLVNFTSGCAFHKLGVAGAKDAQGKELEPDLNPVLELHMPCHGDGTSIVNLSGRERPAIPVGTLVLDTDAKSGWILARNGSIIFLIAADGGAKQPVAKVEPGAWARFLPDGSILVGDGNNLRVVSQHGEVKRTVGLPGQPVGGAIAPDGKSAVLLLKKGAVRLSLTEWTVQSINEAATFDPYARVTWAGDELLIIPDLDRPYTRLHLASGEIKPPAGAPKSYSPDGTRIVDAQKGGVFTAGGEQLFALTDNLEAGNYPYAIWAPDNRHVFFPGGQVIDIETGKQVAAFTNEFPTCKPVPRQLGLLGTDLLAIYVVPCH